MPFVLMSLFDSNRLLVYTANNQRHYEGGSEWVDALPEYIPLEAQR